MGQLCLAGALSGAIVSFVLTPVELIKCKMQVQPVANPASSHQTTSHHDSWSPRFPRASRPKYRSPVVGGGFGATGHLSEPPLASFSRPNNSSLSIVVNTLKQHGFTGLYRGHFGTLLREVAGGAAWFGAYEFAVKKMIEADPMVRSKEDLHPWQLVCAGAAAGLSYNAALFPADVIKSRQQTCPNGGSKFMTIARELYLAEGYRGFYRGFGITMARSAPSSGIIFLTYELLSRNLTVEY